MKTQYKNFIGKVSQAGSLMVEAMAMLALISLVTPTLYKKSAERTTELQDINTATHMRTIMKAVDNYVSANYESLVDGELKNDGAIKKINLSDGGVADGIHDYFPYGYKFDELKNFETPKVTLKKQGGSITSFVELPKKMDIGEMRAARIASMVGSNGGYVNSDQRAQGVGGIWSLEKGDLTGLGFTGGKGSIVVASSEAINTASSGALENEKYLQRTKVESEDQLWRNTMVTDLYMGGVHDANKMYKILGVEQLILGDVKDGGIDANLIVRANNEQGMNGSAWVEDTLSAMSEAFVVGGTTDAPELTLSANGAGDNEIFGADIDQVAFYRDNVVMRATDGDTADTAGATFNVNTQMTQKLTVAGSTAVAVDDGTTFKAGRDGKYISADAAQVSLLGGRVKVDATNPTDAKTEIKTEKTEITGKTKIGTGTKAPKHEGLDPQLNVQGNAYVSGILEAGQIETEKFKTLALHAGGTVYDEGKQWLNATADGVVVQNPNGNKIRLQIQNGEDTGLYNEKGKSAVSSAVVLGSTDAQLRGEDLAELYTTETKGLVNIQDGALKLEGTGKTDTNKITMQAQNVIVNGGAMDINMERTSVNSGVFEVVDPTSGSSNPSSFYVNPVSGGEVNITSNQLEITNNPLLNVLPNEAAGDPKAAVEITPKMVAMSEVDVASPNKVVEVDLEYGKTSSDDSTNRASVYIRRGVIELESPSGSGYKADEGYGYVEAGRFVSNAYDSDGQDIAMVTENTTTGHKIGVTYDRYMVNPAYTSVMHDIKLTTRGGARLSDILPDFINKGIYVVNNTYKDNGFDINQIKVDQNLGASSNKDIKEVSGTALTGEEQWASPFLGVVPTPLCPPGYARVITITPAGFMMGQAGQMTKTPHASGKSRWVVNEYSVMQDLGKADVGTNSTVTGAQYTTSTITDQGGSEHVLYYLGHAMEPTATIEDSSGAKRPYSPQPLYFQQSTWLKSMVIPQAVGKAGSCNASIGSGEGCTGFVGWSAIMGFVYPGSLYKEVIKQITGQDPGDGELYWNIFPVRAQTLEAYATVYCYFDRTNLYGSGNDPKYVDQYDQLNKFHHENKEKERTDNKEYIKRLNDPSLKYTNPW